MAPDAPMGEVRRAYVERARSHHPDYFATADASTRAAAERRMQAINEAWAVLGQPGRRAAYDRSSGAEGDDPRARFRPHEPDAEEPDPLDVPDRPYRPPPTGRAAARRRASTLVPVLLFALSVTLAVAGLVLASTPLLALAALVFAGSCIGFLVLPLVLMAEATRDEG